MKTPFVFIAGCPRSGTTLLQRMLDSHPLLAVANDTHFIPRAIEGVPAGVNPTLTAEIVDRVRNYHRFHRLGLSDEAVRAAAVESRTYQEFVSALYKEFARMNGKLLAGEKTPDYVRCLPVLHGLFPWAKVIHIIRDGRDVALSAMQWAREDKGPGKFRLWQENPLAVCALWWRWQVSTGRSGAVGLGPEKYREVRYEELVTNTESVLRDLSDFLGLEFSQKMINYYVGKTRQEPGLSAKKAYLPPTTGLRDWRKQLPEQDIVLFEALAGDLLNELGYQRLTSIASPEMNFLAGELRQKWEAELTERQAKKMKRQYHLDNQAAGGTR